jgi:hypothetical protein
MYSRVDEKDYTVGIENGKIANWLQHTFVRICILLTWTENV